MQRVADNQRANEIRNIPGPETLAVLGIEAGHVPRVEAAFEELAPPVARDPCPGLMKTSYLGESYCSAIALKNEK